MDHSNIYFNNSPLSTPATGLSDSGTPVAVPVDSVTVKTQATVSELDVFVASGFVGVFEREYSRDMGLKICCFIFGGLGLYSGFKGEQLRF